MPAMRPRCAEKTAQRQTGGPETTDFQKPSAAEAARHGRSIVQNSSMVSLLTQSTN